MSTIESQQRVSLRVGVISAVVLVIAAATDFERAWSNLLVIAFFLLSPSLGACFFLAVTSICGARWHLGIRAVPAAIASWTPLAGALMLATLALNLENYTWHHGSDGDAGTFWFKEYWLTKSFWAVRAILYVVVWTVLSKWLVRVALRRDEQRCQSGIAGAIFLIVFAPTVTLAGIDWLMALEPMWFSTMWGVYCFAGLFQATLALCVVLCLIFSLPNKLLQETCTDKHLHDLGQLLLGFSCFWMYIWFSQYMLIWYSNLPEETSYFVLRTQNGWGSITIVLIILNWIIPFFVLLPRRAKTNRDVMMRVACAVLVGRWVDLYLIVFPDAESRPAPVFGLWEMAAIGLLIGTTGWLVGRSLGSLSNSEASSRSSVADYRPTVLQPDALARTPARSAGEDK